MLHRLVIVFLLIFVLRTAFLIRDLQAHKTEGSFFVPDMETMLEQFSEEQKHIDLQFSRYRFSQLSESISPKPVSGISVSPYGSSDSSTDFDDGKNLAIILPYETRWADFPVESLDYVNDQILEEQLDRFESSLTEEGRHELGNRLQMGIERLQKNEVPGFEGISRNADMTFLTANPETLTPHKKRIRDRIYLRRKKITLMQMHAEYIGLFDGGSPLR